MSDTNTSKKAPKKSKVDVILNAFRKLYDKQLSHSIELKQAALKRALIQKSGEEYTEEAFVNDIAKRVNLLLSSRFFTEECDVKHVDAYAAATHFALTGWQSVADYVLRRGRLEFVATDEWSEPMYEYNRLVRCERHIADVCPCSQGQATAKTAAEGAAA